MIKSIFYKEWLKLRLFWLLAIIAHLGLIIYLLLSLRSILLSAGIVETWATMIGRDVMMINPLMYVPLVTGVCLALCQWLPEMQAKRIRLTLHLPIDYSLSIGSMLLYAIVGLCIIYALDATILAIVEQCWLPNELVWRSFITSLPWYFGGLVGYSVCSWCILEPQWRIRCINILIGAPLTSICFITSQPACYSKMFPWLIVLLLATMCLPLYSVYRFKLGKQ